MTKPTPRQKEEGKEGKGFKRKGARGTHVRRKSRLFLRTFLLLFFFLDASFLSSAECVRGVFWSVLKVPSKAKVVCAKKQRRLYIRIISGLYQISVDDFICMRETRLILFFVSPRMPETEQNAQKNTSSKTSTLFTF